ncbi:hypothetical protein [Pseudoalteromonas luteoviolacea]|uniref:hypothetical protein n=1 Tax=Pseudoalteromonas luteoviolacea TaxID=43657 RepID=UPI00114D8580|nr:hypothetical protein [Pseudoalteromonas luteoviolacea]TQF69566.1 hypothetical protein FLM44_00165 [Pseudoalteromonas luteoviolacea]
MGSNWDWSRQQGRRKRIEAELAAHKLSLPFNKDAIPIHSLDGTMQSQFEHGWYSVTAVDIQSRLNGDTTYHDVSRRLDKQFGESRNG